MKGTYLCLIVLLAGNGVWCDNVGGTRQTILHDVSDGGYTEILLAIDENVPENLQLITRIQV